MIWWCNVMSWLLVIETSGVVEFREIIPYNNNKTCTWKGSNSACRGQNMWHHRGISYCCWKTTPTTTNHIVFHKGHRVLLHLVRRINFACGYYFEGKVKSVCSMENVTAHSLVLKTGNKLTPGDCLSCRGKAAGLKSFELMLWRHFSLVQRCVPAFLDSEWDYIWGRKLYANQWKWNDSHLYTKFLPTDSEVKMPFSLLLFSFSLPLFLFPFSVWWHFDRIAPCTGQQEKTNGQWAHGCRWVLFFIDFHWLRSWWRGVSTHHGRLSIGWEAVECGGSSTQLKRVGIGPVQDVSAAVNPDTGN